MTVPAAPGDRASDVELLKWVLTRSGQEAVVVKLGMPIVEQPGTMTGPGPIQKESDG